MGAKLKKVKTHRNSTIVNVARDGELKFRKTSVAASIS